MVSIAFAAKVHNVLFAKSIHNLLHAPTTKAQSIIVCTVFQIWQVSWQGKLFKSKHALNKWVGHMLNTASKSTLFIFLFGLRCFVSKLFQKALKCAWRGYKAWALVNHQSCWWVLVRLTCVDKQVGCSVCIGHLVSTLFKRNQHLNTCYYLILSPDMPK